MRRITAYVLTAAFIEATMLVPVRASPSCLRDQKAYQLTGDSIEWSMTIVPGADCIQGLRWSYMQVYAVWVLKQPKGGELMTVGSGFRYFAKPGFSGTDKFTLVVVGKNRHEEGYSTVEVTVSPSDGPTPPGAKRRLEANAAATGVKAESSRIADAAASR